MRTIYILLICIISLYLIYQVYQKYITQENFDPSLVPVSSIISLANMAQKLVTGSGTFTFPNNFSIGSTTAPHDLIVTSYASIGGNTNIGGNMIIGDNTTIKGNSTITQSVTVPKIVGKNGSLNINSNLSLLNNLTVTNNLTVKTNMNINNKLNVTKNFNGGTISSLGNVNVIGNINVDNLNATASIFNNVNANILNTNVNFLNLTVPTVFKYIATDNVGYIANDGSTKKIFDTIGNSRYNISGNDTFQFVNLSFPDILAAPTVTTLDATGILSVNSINTYILNTNKISVQNGSDGGYNTFSIIPTSPVGGTINCDNLTITDLAYGANAKVNINGALNVTGSVTVTNLKTTTNTDNSIYDILPVGSIMMWWNTNRIDIPTNWNLCDGNGGRPNMSGSYIVGGNGGDYGQSNPELTDLINLGNDFCGTNVSDNYRDAMIVNFIIRTS